MGRYQVRCRLERRLRAVKPLSETSHLGTDPYHVPASDKMRTARGRRKWAVRAEGACSPASRHRDIVAPCLTEQFATISVVRQRHRLDCLRKYESRAQPDRCDFSQCADATRPHQSKLRASSQRSCVRLQIPQAVRVFLELLEQLVALIPTGCFFCSSVSKPWRTSMAQCAMLPFKSAEISSAILLN